MKMNAQLLPTSLPFLRSSMNRTVFSSLVVLSAFSIGLGAAPDPLRATYDRLAGAAYAAWQTNQPCLLSIDAPSEPDSNLTFRAKFLRLTENTTRDLVGRVVAANGWPSGVAVELVQWQNNAPTGNPVWVRFRGNALEMNTPELFALGLKADIPTTRFVLVDGDDDADIRQGLEFPRRLDEAIVRSGPWVGEYPESVNRQTTVNHPLKLSWTSVEEIRIELTEPAVAGVRLFRRDPSPSWNQTDNRGVFSRVFVPVPGMSNRRHPLRMMQNEQNMALYLKYSPAGAEANIIGGPLRAWPQNLNWLTATLPAGKTTPQWPVAPGSYLTGNFDGTAVRLLVTQNLARSQWITTYQIFDDHTVKVLWGFWAADEKGQAGIYLYEPGIAAAPRFWKWDATARTLTQPRSVYQPPLVLHASGG